MRDQFQGFTPETVEFMWGIRFQTERSWFEAHKEVYLKELYRPMQDLGRQTQLALVEKFPGGTTPPWAPTPPCGLSSPPRGGAAAWASGAPRPP